MDNSIFSKEELEVLLTFSKWHVISTKFSEYAPTSAPDDYRKWIKQNTHKHPYKEMFFVISGNTFFSLNGISYHCTPGTLFLINPGVKHDDYYPPFANNFRHIWFRLARKTLLVNAGYIATDSTYQKNVYSIICHQHSGMSFLEKWDYLFQAPESQEEASLLELKYAWGNLISELCRDGFHNKAEITTRESEVRKIIEAVADHIKETDGKDLDWDGLAHFAGYSKYHFGRLFKKYTGQTVHDFINNCRIDRSRQLLEANYTQKEIADELGFSCASAFSRWLRDNVRKGK